MYCTDATAGNATTIYCGYLIRCRSVIIIMTGMAVVSNVGGYLIHVAACGPRRGARMEINLEMGMGEIKITPCDLGGIWGVLGVRK